MGCPKASCGGRIPINQYMTASSGGVSEYADGDYKGHLDDWTAYRAGIDLEGPDPARWS